MSGGKGGNTTSTVTIPPEVLARYNSVNATAEKAAATPFQSYGGQFVAPLNSTQTSGIANTNAAVGQAQPYFGAATNQIQSAQGAYQPYQGAATNLALGAAGSVDPHSLDIGKYLSPYLGTVLGSTANLLDQNNQQQQAGQLGNAIRSGAFGGDRAGIAAANLEQQQNLANANIYSGIANQGFNTALGAAQQQQGVDLSAGQANRGALMASSQQIGNLGQQGYTVGANTANTLAGLGAGAQSAALQGAQAQLAAGQTEQQTAQAGDTAKYNQFLQQQSYPFQTAQFLANIAEGTGSLSGNTTSTNTVQNGMFSDRRLKENIKPIGKTFDGQTIYSYHYKGEQRPEIGLIAQEVEKKHPEAVGLAGGYKTVHYGKATEDAAERGHFAAGGLVPANDREGYYSGGMPYSSSGFDPAATAQMMATYQAMYGPLLSHGASGPGAVGGIVPQASLPVGQLHPAQVNVPQGPSAVDTATSYAKAGDALGKLGDKIGAWHYGDKSKDGDSASSLVGAVKGLFSKNGDSLRSEDSLSASNADDLARQAQAREGHGLYADGGGVIPYIGTESNALAIPDDEKRYKMQTADAPSSGGGGSGWGGLVSGIGGAASAGLSIAKLLPVLGISDKRLKENIKPVGKTFDGQTVYSYHYKGDPTPRMGLIAQEVEKHHPDAVASVHGLKMVHYGKATDASAKRGKFAAGGDVDPEDESLLKQLTPSLDAGENEYPLLAAPKAKIRAKPEEYAAPDSEGPSGKFGISGDPVKSTMLGQSGSSEQIASLIEKAEGSGRNPKSSAIGPFQILNATLRANASEVAPDLAKKIAGMSDSELTAYRAAHPELADAYKAVGQKLTTDNYNMLGNSGLPQTAGNTYLAHFLGSGGAKAVLRANTSTPVSALLSKGAISANASVLEGKTAGEVADWAAKRMASMALKRAAGGRAGYAIKGGVPEAALAQDDSEGAPTPALGDAIDKALTTEAANKKRAELAAIQAAARPAARPVDVAPAVEAANTAIAAKPLPETSSPAAAPVESLSTAPTATAPTAPASGLGAGSPAAAPELGRLQAPDMVSLDTSPKRGFFKGLAHGDASSIIPLLSGLSAFAATPTSNPLTALASGLGAGATAAQAQNQFAADKYKIGAQQLAAQSSWQSLPLQAQRAKAEYLSATSGSASQKLVWLQQYQPIANYLRMQGHPDEVLEAQVAAFNRQVAADTHTPSAGVVSPRVPEVDFTSPAALQRAGIAASVAGMPGGTAMTGVAQNALNSGRQFDAKGDVINTPGSISAAVAPQVAGSIAESSMAERNRANAESQQARDQVGTASQLRDLLVDADGKPKVLGGPLEKYRAGIGSVLMSAGMSPEWASRITRTDVSNAIAANNLRTAVAADVIHGNFGPGVFRSPSEFLKILDVTPGTQIPSLVSAWILDHNVIPKAQNTIAWAEYLNGQNPASDLVAKSTAWKTAHPWYTPTEIRVGEVYQGHRYLGGDKSVKANWKKVTP